MFSFAQMYNLKVGWCKSSGIDLTKIIFYNECLQGKPTTVLNVLKMVQSCRNTPQPYDRNLVVSALTPYNVNPNENMNCSQPAFNRLKVQIFHTISYISFLRLIISL